jgi:phosphoribosyl-AMP cyclohydrolase / phosphoribosyl-ATP pyrophosphohydrolase
MAELPITFDSNGLIPVIVQDHLTGEVRMFAFATMAAVRGTMETGRATFWSRSRGQLWEKGQTSGNEIRVRRVLVDCDADCLLYSADPCGPSCHTGAPSCFFQVLDGETLARTGEQAQTVLLHLESGLDSQTGSKAEIGSKILSDAGELAMALEGQTDERVVEQAADIVSHVIAGLRARAIPFRQVMAELERRGEAGAHP